MHILVKGNVRTRLRELDMEYEDEDMKLVMEHGTCAMYEINDLDVFVFRVRKKSYTLVPVNTEQYADTEPMTILQYYFEFLTEAEDAQEIRDVFIRLSNKYIPGEVWKWHIPYDLIHSEHEYVNTKKGSDLITKRTYFASESLQISSKDFPLDIRDVHKLCKGELDAAHLFASLRPTKTNNVMINTFIHEGTKEMVAIRVTKLYKGHKGKIMGAFACSCGYGRLIQEYTEEVLSSHEHVFFAQEKSKHFTFELAAVPTAEGFWKTIGFEPNGKQNSDGLNILTKRLRPSDEYSPTKAATKKSPPPITSSKPKRLRV